nr:Protein-tyrosine phosphatase domain containing protein [Haemonchus contortus]
MMLGRVCVPVNDYSLLVGFFGIPCDHSDVLSVELLLDSEELLIRKDDQMVILVACTKLSALLDSRLLIRGAEDSSLLRTKKSDPRSTTKGQNVKGGRKKGDFLKKNDDIDEEALGGAGKAEDGGAVSTVHDNRSKWAATVISSKPIKVLSREFASNKRYKPPGYTTEAYDKNEPKNRYNDIICIDSTRVVLKDRHPEDDYIHASWMTMPDHFKYICTQGPLLETLEDFWHMLFCERSTVIVQLCDFVEERNMAIVKLIESGEAVSAEQAAPREIS